MENVIIDRCSNTIG